MTFVGVLAVIAIFQGAFLVLLVMFLLVRRQVVLVQRAAYVDRRRAVAEPLQRWLTESAPVEPFVASLRALPGSTALAYVGKLVRTTLPAGDRGTLSRALRDEPWVQRALGRATSSRWSRRLEAARCLAIVGTPQDSPMLEGLLTDERPAVAIAAVSALPRVADEALVGKVLDRFVTLPGVVRMYLQDTLRELHGVVEPPLTARLVDDAPPRSLARLIDLAGALALPTSLERAVQFASHEEPRVRIAVAGALRRLPRERTVQVLIGMLADQSVGVRAVAAQALGEIASVTALSALVAAAHDDAYMMRYRATLALAQLGEPGRTAIRALRLDPDPYVADMATLVIGLGDGAVLDMVEW